MLDSIVVGLLVLVVREPDTGAMLVLVLMPDLAVSERYLTRSRLSLPEGP